MIIVKFIALFGCNCVFSAAQMNYCKISSNHTLCQYKTPGPSPKCKFYDSTALLSNQEIKDILHNINERRNFIANGNSHLPQAANMKKMHWSTELAKFAQRWADQCDPSLHPNKEDECRDLDNVKVGQNIGSVTGRLFRLSVKEFIEIWFSEIHDYSGSISYYNQSRDNKTNYFTQLIWAETEFVGCGKVKFYESIKKVFVERLVCNFAPKGNIDGKPIYTIGYAGTKCTNAMISDKDYKGLCDYAVRELRTQRPLVSGLLRIRNLSNDTVKHESNPISNNFKQRQFRKNLQKNKKIRHVLSKYSYEPLRLAPLQKKYMKKSLIHVLGEINDNNGHERGHSRIYHGHEEPAYPIPHYYEANVNQEVTVAPIYLISSPNYIKDYQYVDSSQAVSNQLHCYNHQGTRHGYHQSIEWQNDKNPTPTPHLCPSTTACTVTCPNACPPLLTTVSNSQVNCQCSRHAFQSHIPNMVRSGIHMTTRISFPIKYGYQQYYDSTFIKRHKIHEKKENYNTHEQISDENVYPEYSMGDRDYFYRSFDSSIRKKRKLEDEKFS